MDYIEQYRKTVSVLWRWRICKIYAVRVLFAMMIAPRLSYQEAVEITALYDGRYSKEELHAQLCYALLKAGIEERPQTFFQNLRRSEEDGD